MRNVEIKAKCRDESHVTNIARKLSNSEGERMAQRDYFYNVTSGRLKMRRHENKTGQLIRYSRDDVKTAKLSTYSILNLDEQQADILHGMLIDAYGLKGEVHKIRNVYLTEQTRIHIDNVEGLGHYMELEVVLEDSQTLEHGQKIAKHLQSALGIPDEDLIDCAYLDLLAKNKE